MRWREAPSSQWRWRPSAASRGGAWERFVLQSHLIQALLLASHGRPPRKGGPSPRWAKYGAGVTITHVQYIVDMQRHSALLSPLWEVLEPSCSVLTSVACPATLCVLRFAALTLAEARTESPPGQQGLPGPPAAIWTSGSDGDDQRRALGIQSRCGKWTGAGIPVVLSLAALPQAPRTLRKHEVCLSSAVACTAPSDAMPCRGTRMYQCEKWCCSQSLPTGVEARPCPDGSSVQIAPRASTEDRYHRRHQSCSLSTLGLSLSTRLAHRWWTVLGLRQHEGRKKKRVFVSLSYGPSPRGHHMLQLEVPPAAREISSTELTDS